MRYTLGIDFGGGSSKATLLSEEGNIVAENTVEYPTSYPCPGFIEQNPEDWYLATKANIAALLSSSGVRARDVVALSFDAATHTAVVMDEDFVPLCPAIYWTDIRSTEEVAILKRDHLDLILCQNLHMPDTIWTLPQLMWIRTNRPEIFGKIRKICFAKDYVRHKFTGDYVTDNIEAEGSMLFDYNKQCWSEELCALAGISPGLLPRIVKPTDIVGYVSPRAASETGLCEGTPVLCGTTDTAMEVFAAGAVGQGQMTLKLATAGRICVVTDRACPDRNLINYSYVLDGMWYPGTATKACASSLRWYRDAFGGNYRELDTGAETVPPCADGLFYHPYINGELTPYGDPSLKGSFVGIRASHTKAHFTRAVLEGVAFSMKDCLQTLDGLGIPHKEIAILIGGGAKSKIWRQITADVLGISLVQKRYADSSFGSAMFAGIAAGIWKTPNEAVAVCNKEVSVTSPDAARNRIYADAFVKYKKIHDVLAEVYHS